MHPLLRVSLITLNRMFGDQGLSHPQNISKAKAVLLWVYNNDVKSNNCLDDIVYWLTIHHWKPDDIRQITAIIQQIEKDGNIDIQYPHNLSENFFEEIYDKTLAFLAYYYLSGLFKIMAACTVAGQPYLIAKHEYLPIVQGFISNLVKRGYQVQYGKQDKERLQPVFVKNNEVLECLVTSADTTRAENEIMDSIR